MMTYIRKKKILKKLKKSKQLKDKELRNWKNFVTKQMKKR